MKVKTGDIDADGRASYTEYCFIKQIDYQDKYYSGVEYREIQIIARLINDMRLKGSCFNHVYESNTHGCVIAWGEKRTKSVNVE